MLDRRGRIKAQYAAIYARLETIVSRADKMQTFLPEKLNLIDPPAPLLKRSKRRINAGVRAYIADTASALYTLNAELNSLIGHCDLLKSAECWPCAEQGQDHGHRVYALFKFRVKKDPSAAMSFVGSSRRHPQS